MGYTLDDYVPPKDWGKDHWTTLAYIETVMVDCAGFQLGADPRMRSNRRNYRVMIQQCPHPKRTNRVSPDLCQVMDPEHGSVLSDGSVVEGHDDWCCIQDMAAVGLFTVTPEDVEPKEILHFSDLGRAVAARLREHKAAGGYFRDFRWDPETAPAP